MYFNIAPDKKCLQQIYRGLITTNYLLLRKCWPGKCKGQTLVRMNQLPHFQKRKKNNRTLSKKVLQMNYILDIRQCDLHSKQNQNKLQNVSSCFDPLWGSQTPSKSIFLAQSIWNSLSQQQNSLSTSGYSRIRVSLGLYERGLHFLVKKKIAALFL